jgi:hypothetical protein
MIAPTQKRKATVPSGAKKGRKAKEPLAELSEHPLKFAARKIGLGGRIERTVSGFLGRLYKVHPNMIMVCGYSLHASKTGKVCITRAIFNS